MRPTAEKRDGITVLKMRSDLLPGSFDQMAKRRPGEPLPWSRPTTGSGLASDEWAVVRLAREAAAILP